MNKSDIENRISKILIIAATSFELGPLREYLEKNYQKENDHFFNQQHCIDLLVSGIGMMATTHSLGRALVQQPYDLVIQVGIAGAFDRQLSIGDVVNVVVERIGDIGVEEADGRFTDLFELELLSPDEFPYQNGQLRHPNAASFHFLKNVEGLTVNKVHGHNGHIEAIKKKYRNVVVETMEGAALFYVCLQQNTPFLAIKGISNYVESRNKANWNIPLAIHNSNNTVLEILKML